ncbi:MAG: hypothetical protein MJA82_21435 [Clostridia bacterium]|nr:hypothetical protein [Clostridia bacterium]
MRDFIKKKKIVWVFLVVICVTSFYYAYKRFKINRPISAKLVFNTEDSFNRGDNFII